MRLLGFLHPYRASLIVSSLLAVASQIAGILVPVLTGVVINEIDGGPDTQVLVFEIAAIVALGLLRGGLMYGRRILSGKQALGAGWSVLDATGAILEGRATYFEPTYNASGWMVNAEKISTFASNWKLRLRVVCGSIG